MQCFVLITQFALLFHSTMFVIMHGSINSSSAEAFFTTINSVMGCFKIYSVIAKQNEIAKLNLEIENFVDRISYKNRNLFSKDISRYRFLVNFVVLSTFVLIMIVYVIVPLMEVFVAFITHTKAPRYFLNSYWFPFDPYEYYFLVRIYNLTIVNITSHCILSCEGFIMLTFGQLSILFRCLAEDIVDVINEHDVKNNKLTEKRLTLKIQQHVRLLEITKTMTSYYEIALLAHTLCFAGSTCFILLKALVVDTGSNVASSMATVVNMFMYFYYICYFGEKVVGGVS